MDDICWKLLEHLSNFLHTYPVDAEIVTLRRNSIDTFFPFMRKYRDIPEVWVPRSNVVLRRMVSSLQEMSILDAANRDEGLAAQTALIERMKAFEGMRSQWLREHPQELEFVFKKMGYEGYGIVEEWGVTDCRQFRAITENDLICKITLAVLPDDYQEQEDTILELQKTHIIDVWGTFHNGTRADLPSVLETYARNDVHSMHLRTQLVKLHKHINNGQDHDEAITQSVSTFLYKVAYKLWGWGDFVAADASPLPTPSGDVAPQMRDVFVMEMTGVPGDKAKLLNGMYVETHETHNERRLFRKTSMYKGFQHWLRSNNQGKWVVSRTNDVEQNNLKAACCTVNARRVPLKAKWEVFDTYGDKKWTVCPTVQCEQRSCADVLWALDDCDVVFNALPASEIQDCITACLALRTQMHNWYAAPPPDIITHLDGIGQALQETLAARQGATAPEPGECSICAERQASEILLPCKHLCLCRFCSLAIEQCPFCRTPVEASCDRRVYARRRSAPEHAIFDATARMSNDTMMTSLLLQLCDLH